MFHLSASRADPDRHTGAPASHEPDDSSGAKGFFALTALLAAAFLFF